MRPSGDVPAIESFREFELEPTVLAAIEAMGIVKPTPIQALAIGPALQGKDLIAKAETGTGKTLAFGAPMMSKIDPSRSSVLGLVLCPTRELAQQVAGVLEKLGEPRAIKVALLVGGEPIHPQIAALKQGAQVVVGTPGRVIDLYGQRFLSFPWTEFAVLDEADQMLEIGFIDDVKKILSFTPDERQTMLFSATFPDAVLQLARESTRNPIEIATAKGVATVKSIDQSFIRVSRDEQSLALIRLIEQSEPDDVFLVFCDKRTYVDALMRRLERLPFSVKALHGGYDQAARFRVMSAFRTGEVKALVATDVASRGLDVAHVTHVVNFGVPQDISDYTHRIGRTGRAGRTGVAITLVTPEAERRWHAIERAAPWKIREVDAPGRYRARPRDDTRSVSDEAPASDERPRREPREHAGAGRPPRRSRDAERDDAAVSRGAAPRGGLPARAGDRPRGEERAARPERPLREDRARHGERPNRDEQTPRDGRDSREARAGRGEREARPERAARDARTPRTEREAPRSREERDVRPTRATHGDDRGERSSRAAAEERHARPARDEHRALPPRAHAPTADDERRPRRTRDREQDAGSTPPRAPHAERRPAESAPGERAARPERSERHGRPGRPERPERPGRPERPERAPSTDAARGLRRSPAAPRTGDAPRESRPAVTDDFATRHTEARQRAERFPRGPERDERPREERPVGGPRRGGRGRGRGPGPRADDGAPAHD
ncbi:MAG: DEAD/DEAH box helicase [Planctomycetes bacterium]|nr:DEAD/DEAH box helicase [Planctomycetota bacterium]